MERGTVCEGTVIRLLKTNEFAIIRERYFRNAVDFSHYIIHIEGRENPKRGGWTTFDGDFEIECLPEEKF